MFLGSARLWRAGERHQAFANFSLERSLCMETKAQGNFAGAERRNQHPEHVRCPILCGRHGAWQERSRANVDLVVFVDCQLGL